MHAVLHDTTSFCDEHMHAVLHDATGIRHGQLCFTSVNDVAATFGLTASAVLDSKDDAVSTMPLWCHLADYTTTTTTIHVQPDGYNDPACVLPAALSWCSVLDKCSHVVIDNKIDMPSHVTQ